MRRLLLLLGVLGVLGLSPAGPVAAQQSPDIVPQARTGVLVLGVAGLRWDDLGPQTPTLLRLARQGAVGALSVKARPATSCASDGWLTLGAGNRADAFDPRPLPCRPGTGAGPEALERNAASPDGARLGALAAALGGRFEARGAGARLALGGSGQAGAPVVVVDAGTLGVTDRATDLRLADDAVAGAIARLAPGVDLIVVGVSEATGESTARLHVAIATGPSFPRGALRSASTRRAPYVQLIDVAPTVLGLQDQQVSTVMNGQPWQVSGAAPSLAQLVDLDRQAQGQRSATVPFFVLLLGVPLLVGTLAAWRGRWLLAEVVALTATAGLGASYLANLVPWWRAEVPLLGLLAIVVPISILAASCSLILVTWWSTRQLGPTDNEDQQVSAGGAVGGGRSGAARPAQLVCGLVAVVLVLDLVTGAHLQMGSVAGYSPLVAGRFAGIGNVAFGVFAAAVLLAACASKRLVVLVAVAVLAVVVDGAPMFGSDVGGVLSLVPALVLLTMLRTGSRVSLLRLALAGAAGATVVTAFALADFAQRPAERTHLGRFVQDVVDGTAGQVLARKASAVLDLLFHSPVTALLPLVVAAAAYLVVRPPRPLAAAFEVAPGWRHGLFAVGLVALVGFAVNDSGAAIPALALCVALPATVAVTLRARRERTGSQRL